MSSAAMESDEFHRCDECNRDFTQIKVHRALVHRGQEQIMCNLCGLQFVKSKHLLHHSTEHRKNNVKCHVCRRKDFEDLKHFFKHLEEHSSLHVFSCSFCNKSFALKSHFDKHIKRKHDDSISGYNWNITQQNSVYIDNVLTEIKQSPRSIDESEPPQTFPCIYCSKSFIFKQDFDKHMRRKHGNSMFYGNITDNLLKENTFEIKESPENLDKSCQVLTCSICSKSFTYRKDFDKHMRRNHGNSMFNENSLLESSSIQYEECPQNLDEDESCPVLTCSICSKYFTLKKDFDKHMKREHGKSIFNGSISENLLEANSFQMEETPRNLDQLESCPVLTCSICSKTFPVKEKLDKHVKRKHDNIIINENSNSFPQNSLKNDENRKKRKHNSDIDKSNVDDISKDISNHEENFDSSYEKSKSHNNSKRAKKNVGNSIEDNDFSVDNDSISNVDHEITLGNINKYDVSDMNSEKETIKSQNREKKRSLWDGSNDFNMKDVSFKSDNIDDKDNIIDRTCFICKGVFDRKGLDNIFQHYVNKHNDNSMECKTCGKTLQHRYLYYHALKHNDASPWKCNDCSMTFTCKFYHQRHMVKVHEKTKCYKCEVCDENFIYFLPYQAHLLEHYEDRQYSCEYCLRKFKYKKYLAPHQLKSTCNLCDIVFNCKTVFDNHIDNVHSLDALFDCPYCDNKFCKERQLNLHITRKHADLVKRKVIYCKFCDYITHASYNLSRHVKSRHTVR